MLYIRRVMGTSMLPTYEEGQVIIALKTFNNLRVHDIVIISHGGLEKIKRVSELSGNMIYVRGDNPKHSTDSRHFGWLEKHQVKGKVIWPRNKIRRYARPKSPK
jgi:phage repressor protein C with HTH and peptisase S24 domain